MKGCRPLNNEEIAKALSGLATGLHAQRDQALFILGIRSGFRISELLSLRIKDVYEHGSIVDRVLVSRKSMKGKLEGRQVVLHDEAKAALSKLLCLRKTIDGNDFLFQSRQGTNRPLNRKTAWRLLKSAYARVGLTGKLGTHSMRKTFAKRVYEKLGKDLIKTQRAMGHKSVTSTAAYLSFSEEEIDDAILKS